MGSAASNAAPPIIPSILSFFMVSIQQEAMLASQTEAGHEQRLDRQAMDQVHLNNHHSVAADDGCHT